jgi:ATP-dependent RNA helicase DeaD
MFSLIDKVEKIEVNNEQIGEFMPVIYKKLAWLDREELIKHFVSVEFNRFLTYYENAPDINVDESHQNERDFSGRGERRERGDRGERGESRDRGRRNDRDSRNSRDGRDSREILSKIRQGRKRKLRIFEVLF